MKRQCTLHRFLLFMMYLSITGFAQQKINGADYEPGTIIVKLKRDVQVMNSLNRMRSAAKEVQGQSSLQQMQGMGVESIDRLNQKFRVREIRPLIPKPNPPQNIMQKRNIDAALQDLSTLVKITFDESVDIEQVLQAYASDANVVYAEPNYIYYYNDKIPDDTRFDEQWALHNTGQTGGTPDADIDAPEAWEIQTGDPSVIVGIVDSGVDLDHPDLVANLWVNAGEIPDNGIDDDGNGYVDDVNGYDFFFGNGDPQDTEGHGTHVAGTVAAVSDNGEGVTGVAWNVRIMALKTGTQGYIFSDAAIEAITYAANNGARVTNHSWGCWGASQALGDAFNYADQMGLVSVAAAGNDNTNQEWFPARYDVAIAVASTDHNDVKSSFSNYGFWVDVSAPGSAILSTVLDGQYNHLQGTSMAAPHVAGLAALLFSEHPDWTPAQVRQQIEETADNIVASNRDYEHDLGSGRINAHQALLPAEPRLNFASVAIDDDQYDGSTGNLDGIANAGETLELTVSLQNVGVGTSQSAEIRLRSKSPHVTIMDSVVTIGQITYAGGAVAADHVFSIQVSENAPSGTEILLSLHIADAGGQVWEREFTIPVYSSFGISGQITDLGTGAGIPHAKVTYTGSTSKFVLSDEDGLFEIGNIVDGTYSITVHHPDYDDSAPISVTVPSEQTEINIGLGTSIASVAPINLDFNLDWNTTAAQSFSTQNDGSGDLSYSIIEFRIDDSQSQTFMQAAEYRDALLKSLNAPIPMELAIAEGSEAAKAPRHVSEQAVNKAIEQWRALDGDNPIRTIKAMVVRSWGNIGLDMYRAVWNKLNSEWYDFGPVPVFVEYLVYDSNITYEELVQSNADVLIIASAGNKCPYDFIFKEEEQTAIQRYLDDGHGLIVTAGTLNSIGAPEHTPFFAELLGFDPEALYLWPTKKIPAILEVKQSTLMNNVDQPYLPSVQEFCTPAGDDWNNVIVDADIIAATQDFDAVITVHEQAVYFSNRPEMESNPNDQQALYNAILFAGAGIPWLSIDNYHGDIEPNQGQNIEVTVASKNLSPSGRYESELLVLSNDKANPLVRIPVSAQVGDAAKIEVASLLFDDDLTGGSNGNGDGVPAAGERIELGFTVLNNGSVDAAGLSVQVSSPSQKLTFVQDGAQLGTLGANAQQAFTATAVFDISGDAGDTELVWLNFDFTDDAGAQWQDAVRIELSRYTGVAGTVTATSTGQPVENATVRYYGPLNGTTTTDAAGNYTLSLREGEYRILAEADGFAPSASNQVVLPNNGGSVDFQLTRPILDETITAVSLEFEANGTHTITLTNSGDEVLHYGIVNSAFESKVSEPTDDMLRGDTPLDDSAVNGTIPDGCVAVFMDDPVWNTTVLEHILAFHEIPYKIFKSYDMGTLDLNQFVKVVLVSGQKPLYSINLWNSKARFEAYVEAGGLLQLHTAVSDYSEPEKREYPGGLYVKGENMEDLDIQSGYHPIVNVPTPFDADMLDNWYQSSYGYFSTTPENTLPITVHASKGTPTAVQIQRGNGLIIATQQLVEWYKSDIRFLENMLLFGLTQSTWMTVHPLAGSIQPGENSQIEITLTCDDWMPGETRTETFKIYSNLPGSRVIEVPVQLKRADAPKFAIAMQQFQAAGGDNDDIPESGESVTVQLTFTNNGNIAGSNINCQLSTTTAGVTIQNATLPLGNVDAGQTSAEITFNVDLGAGIPDQTPVQFTATLTGDNGFTQTLTTDAITVLSDVTPPDPITTLQVLAATGNALYVVFDATGDDGAQGQAAVYDLRYSETPITAENFNQCNQVNVASQPKTAGANDTLIVAVLETGKLYYVALVIVDDAGNRSTLSNVVSAQTVKMFETRFNSHQEYIGNENNVINPGERVRITVLVKNLSQSTFNGGKVVADDDFDEYIYKNAFTSPSSLFRSFLSTIGPQEERAAYFTFYVRSNTPDGHVLQIPLTFYDAGNTIIDSDILLIPVTGSDEIPPYVQDAGINPWKHYPLNYNVPANLFVDFREPGVIASVEAIIEDVGGTEIDRKPMALYESYNVSKDYQRYHLKWKVPHGAQYHLRTHAVDAAGNSVTSGPILGFSSDRIAVPADVLVVYDNYKNYETNAHLTYITDSFDRLGVAYDLWNTFFRSFPEITTMREYDAVFWFTPEYTGALDITNERQLDWIIEYLDNGGSLFMAGQDIARGISASRKPEFLPQYLGAEFSTARTNRYRLTGTDGDYLGDGLELSIQGEGGANNQWWQCAITPMPEAVPFLHYDPNSFNANSAENAPAMQASQSDDQVGGVWYESDGRRTIFLSFGFEAITSAVMRDSLISRSMNWLRAIGEEIPPANVADLASGASCRDYAEITWTAPGDDGNTGMATKYDIRYSNSPPGTEIQNWWQTAQKAEGEPDPMPAGTKQTYRLTDVTEDMNYYFLIKTSDRVTNHSGFSNLAITTTIGEPSSVDDLNSDLPETFHVSQNFPNPFNPETTIKYQIPEAELVTISVYNIFGQLVTTLVNNEQSAGYYTIKWRGENDYGVRVSSGVYIYLIKAGDYIRSRKMILLR